MKKWLQLLAYGICLLLPNLGKSQDYKLPVFISDSLDQYIKRGMVSWNIPGLSVAIVKNGKVVMIKGYGVTRSNSNEQVDENTLFMIGSNTKAFTATALTMLQESKMVNLSDRVRKWMPEFRLRDTLASNDIMISDLLSHRIGFETFQGDFTYWGSNLTREEVIKKMSKIRAPYHFRTQWGYCNAAFLTAGELIPRITGRKWEEVVRDSIIRPLKMDRTVVLADEVKKMSNIATPYTVINNKLQELPFANLDNLAPAGSIVSSAKDMSRWLLVQLNNGMIDGNQVLPAKALQATRKAYSIMGVDPSDKTATHFYLYGLGLLISDYNGRLTFSHTGGVDGFLSSLLFIPEEQLGIIVLTNNDQNNFFQDLVNEIRDSYLGLPYKGYSDISLKTFIESRTAKEAKQSALILQARAGKLPDLPLTAFTGSYSNEVYGQIKVSLNKGILNITFSHHPGLVAELKHLQNNSFLCTYSNPTLGVVEMPFKIVDGKVAGLTLRVNDFVESTPYEFSKID